jgi:hypothetical protein
MEFEAKFESKAIQDPEESRKHIFVVCKLSRGIADDVTPEIESTIPHIVTSERNLCKRVFRAFLLKMRFLIPKGRWAVPVHYGLGEYHVPAREKALLIRPTPIIPVGTIDSPQIVR